MTDNTITDTIAPMRFSPWIGIPLRRIASVPQFIDSGIANAVLAVKIRHRRASLPLFQNADGLFVSEPVAMLTRFWVASVDNCILRQIAGCFLGQGLWAGFWERFVNHNSPVER